MYFAILGILFMCHVVHCTRDLTWIKTNPEKNLFFLSVWCVFFVVAMVFFEGFWVFLEVAAFPAPFPSAAAQTLGLPELQGWDTTETSSRWQGRGGWVNIAATHFALDNQPQVQSANHK